MLQNISNSMSVPIVVYFNIKFCRFLNMVYRMQFLKKKVWRAHEKAWSGTFLPPASGLATPDIDKQNTSHFWFSFWPECVGISQCLRMAEGYDGSLEGSHLPEKFSDAKRFLVKFCPEFGKNSAHVSPRIIYINKAMFKKTWLFYNF